MPFRACSPVPIHSKLQIHWKQQSSQTPKCRGVANTSREQNQWGSPPGTQNYVWEACLDFRRRGSRGYMSLLLTLFVLEWELRRGRSRCSRNGTWPGVRIKNPEKGSKPERGRFPLRPRFWVCRSGARAGGDLILRREGRPYGSMECTHGGGLVIPLLASDSSSIETNPEAPKHPSCPLGAYLRGCSDNIWRNEYKCDCFRGAGVGYDGWTRESPLELIPDELSKFRCRHGSGY